MPVIVMLPGIAAYVLHQKRMLQAEMLMQHGKLISDNAYSAILGYFPNGLIGLSLAALTGGIVASLAGKANSISTIFTLDIYKKYIRKEATEKKMVWIGRVTISRRYGCSIAFTWKDSLNIGGEGGFTYIQKYTGFISPGVFAMFILGMFWKRTTGAAIAGLITGFVMAVIFNNYAPQWFGHETILYTAFLNDKGVYEIPFLISMGWSFFFTVVVMVTLSMAGPKVNPKAFALDRPMFKLSPSSTFLIILILLVLMGLYLKFW